MKNGIKAYKGLADERAKKIEQIRALLPERVIRGSIRIQGNRCGTEGCRCKRKVRPILHGLYPYLSFRGKKSNHSILLTGNKYGHAQKAIANYRALLDAVIELSDIDFRILRYHSGLLKGGSR